MSIGAFSGLVDLASVDPSLVTPLRGAVERGHASLFTTGIEPGFATTQFPMAMLSICSNVELILTTEDFTYGKYPDSRFI